MGWKNQTLIPCGYENLENNASEYTEEKKCRRYIYI